MQVNRKLRTATSILLIVIISLQTFSSFVYDAAYSFNSRYIAEKFCVNKDKPAAHCAGHCYLEKQKQQQENSDKQSNDTKREKFDVLAYFVPPINTLDFPISISSVCSYTDGSSQPLAGYSSAVFHPPLA